MTQELIKAGEALDLVLSGITGDTAAEG